MISLLSDRFPHLLIGIKVAKSGYTTGGAKNEYDL